MFMHNERKKKRTIDDTVDDLKNKNENYIKMSRRKFYYMIENTMNKINDTVAKDKSIETLIRIFKPNGTNASKYKFGYEYSDLFYVLNELIRINSSDKRKNTSSFENFKKYFEFSSKATKELKDFQKLTLEYFRNQNGIEYILEHMSGIFNSLKLIFFILKNNNDNEIILNSINIKLRILAKEMLQLSDMLNKNGIKREHVFCPERTAALKSNAKKSLHSGYKDNYEYDADKYNEIEFKKSREPLKKLTIRSLSKITCINYIRSINYLRSIFYYDLSKYADKPVKKDGTPQYYEKIIHVYPMRKPLTSLITKNTHTEKLWKKYISTYKKTFYPEYYVSEVDEYLSDINRPEKISIDCYKEKKLDEEVCNNIRKELDLLYYNIIKDRLKNEKINFSSITNEKNEFYNEKNVVLNQLQLIFNSFSKCKVPSREYCEDEDKNIKYDCRKIMEQITKTNIRVQINKLLQYTYNNKSNELELYGYIKDTWCKCYDTFAKKETLTQSKLINLELEMTKQINAYFDDIFEEKIISIEDNSFISDNGINVHRLKLQKLINIYIKDYIKNMENPNDFYSASFGNFQSIANEIENYSMHGFLFKNAFYQIKSEIINYINLGCDLNININISEKDENDCYYYDISTSLISSQIYASKEFTEAQKHETLNNIVGMLVRKYLNECKNLQEQFINCNTDSEVENHLYRIFDNILNLDKSQSSRNSRNQT